MKDKHSVTFNEGVFLTVIFLLMGVIVGCALEMQYLDDLLKEAEQTVAEYDARVEAERQANWAKPPEIDRYDFSDWPEYIEPAEWATGEPQREEDHIRYPYLVEDVLITHYCTCEICCGRFADGYTYDGSIATPGVTIAADLSLYPLGTHVTIGDAIYTVQDTGVKGDHIDILCASHEEALAAGKYYTSIWVYPNDTYSTD